MGSFDVSCSLTGTPIFEGEPCIMVVLKKDFSPYDHIEWSEYDVEKVIKSTYNDYGRVAPVKGATRKYIESVTDQSKRFYFFICQKA
jgi:hypothetical protein